MCVVLEVSLRCAFSKLRVSRHYSITLEFQSETKYLGKFDGKNMPMKSTPLLCSSDSLHNYFVLQSKLRKEHGKYLKTPTSELSILPEFSKRNNESRVRGVFTMLLFNCEYSKLCVSRKKNEFQNHFILYPRI